MTARFLTSLAAKYNGHEWVLLEPLAFESDVLGRVIEVPVGFPTDLGTVPRLPFAYLFFAGIANEAATLHDYLYSGAEKISRKQADEVFSEAMKASGTGIFRRWPMWLAVRVAGNRYYSKGKTA